MPRNYSNVAEETALTAGINSAATTITVGSNTGYPAVPYTIIIDPGLATEELCEVTSVAGTSWTVTRGVDGTPASSHDNGAVVVHGYSARDLREIQDHVGDSTGVHGIGASASVVGTTDTQTLTNKTLTSPTINGGSITGVTFGSGLTFNSPTLVTPTIASFVNAQHDHSDAANGGEVESSGGGGGAFVAYKRTNAAEQLISVEDDEVAVTFGTLAYNVGNSTWSTAASNTRIVLPTDIANGVWHITAGARVNTADDTSAPYFILVHEDLGTIARVGGPDGGLIIYEDRPFEISAEIQSVAGKWIELRFGDRTVDGQNAITELFMAIHRVG